MSQYMNRRVPCLQACKQGEEDDSCPAECEIAFRTGMLGIKGVHFWLAVKETNSPSGGVRPLFPLLPEEVVSRQLNAVWSRTQPETYHTLGTVAEVSGDACVFRSEGGGRVVSFRTERQLCELISARRNQYRTPFQEIDADEAHRLDALYERFGSDAGKHLGSYLGSLIVSREIPPERRVDLIRKLLRSGGDPNLSLEDTTLLIVSIFHDDSEVARTLIDSGADPNKASDQGRFKSFFVGGLHTPCSDLCNRVLPLTYAVCLDRLGIAQALIETGASVNQADERGATLLLHARSEKAVDLLIRYGASLDARTKSGKTALHYAAYNCDADVVRALIRRGAQVNAADNDRVTPLDIAEYMCQETVSGILRQRGGRGCGCYRGRFSY